MDEILIERETVIRFANGLAIVVNGNGDYHPAEWVRVIDGGFSREFEERLDSTSPVFSYADSEGLEEAYSASHTNHNAW